MKNINLYKGKHGRQAMFVLLLSLFIAIAFSACVDEDSYTPEGFDAPLVLKAQHTDLVLNQKGATRTPFTFTWTTGSNKGTGRAIEYTLQLDKEGNKFHSPLQFYSGTRTYERKWTVAELNDLLLNQLNFNANQSGTIQARVIASIATDPVSYDTSAVVNIVVTPYKPVTETLYLVGDATPNGWDAGNATPMKRDLIEPTTFTYTGSLTPGSLKFLVKQGEWIPSYNKGANENTLLYRETFDDPDDQFTITDAGQYKVTVNLVDLSYSIIPVEGPPYTKLWIVGSATPNDWNIDNPTEMTQDPSDPFVFFFYGNLKAGEFKIPTSTGDWGTMFYRPTSNHPDLNNTEVQLSAGDPDHKWNIENAGAYKVRLDLRGPSISIVPFTPFATLYLVGDATPANWNIDNPTPMVKDSSNPNIFTWTGPLKAGEFKIPVTTGNWSTDYFMPYNAGESIASTMVRFVPGGNPDNKWKVLASEEGTYTITIDQLHQTIAIVKQ